MEQVFVNGLYFSIEFIKVLLAMVYIWRVKPKKNISYAFAVSLFLVMAVSWYTDLSQIGIVYEIINVIIITFFTIGNYRTLLAILTFILIGITDMLIVEIVIRLSTITFDMVYNNIYIEFVCSSISLILLIIYVMLFGRKYMHNPQISKALLPIYIIGGLALSVLVTGIQIVGMDENNRLHHNAVFMGVFLALVFSVGVCILLEHDRRENERLEYVNEMNNRLIEAQNGYYLGLLQKETETKAFRHDIKAQLMCMSMLYENGEYEKLGTYIGEVQAAVSKLSAGIDTGNDYVNAIVADMYNRYPSAKLEWKGIVPATVLTYMDICTLFYNLLKNAFEAATETDEKRVKAAVGVQDNNLFLSISNYYKNVIVDNKGGFQTTKEGDNHGYGIGNIRRCIEKYNGEYHVTLKDNIFQTDIMLLNVVNNEIKE